MPYTSGSQGAETNCASVFMTTLDGLLVAAGFTFVEQVLAGAVTSRIYKSPAAGNYFGQDWFFSITRATDTATTVTLRVFEQYNSTTHLCFNYAPSANSLTPTAQFAVNDAAGKAPDSTSLAGLVLTISASGFNWYTSITPNRVIVATRVSTSNYAVYCGLYEDSLEPVTSPFPLVVGPLNFSAGGFATREPGQTASMLNNFRVALGQYGWTRYTGGASVYTGKGHASRILVTSARSGSADNHRGLLPPDLWMTQMIVGSNGDTLAAPVEGSAKTLAQMTDGASSTAVFVDQAI